MSVPLWINADGGVPEYDARLLRQADTGLLTPGSDRLTGRAGLAPYGSLSSAVSLSGTTWTVRDCVATVASGSPLVGAYRLAVSETSGATAAADGSNPRVDVVAVRVRDDDEDASGHRDGQVVYVEGTAAATPQPPPLPDGHVPLARITVPSSGDPTLQAVYPVTVAAGGVLPARGEPELPATPHVGQQVWDAELSMLLVWDGGRWRPTCDVVHLAGAAPSGVIGSTGMSLTIPLRLRGLFRSYRIVFQGGISSATSGARGLVLRVNAISAAEYRGYAELRRGGSAIRSSDVDDAALAAVGFVAAAGSSMVQITLTPRSTGNTGTITWDASGWANTNQSHRGRTQSNGRWSGTTQTTERFTLRSESPSDEWASLTRADLYGVM